MPRILDTAAVFPEGRPSNLPPDARKPDDGALFARARTRASDPKYSLDTLRDILVRENRRIGAHGDVLAAIGAIGEDAVFVVAGQQAGLFGGPLYTIYKARHAVRLAGRIHEETGIHAVPVFWVASDDPTISRKCGASAYARPTVSHSR